MMNTITQRTELRSDSMRQSTTTLPNELDLDSEVRWQLFTLIGTAASYFGFFVILSTALNKADYSALSLIPLILYDIVKAVFCSIRLYKEWEIESKDDLKDMIECVFMILYKVGVIIKILKPEADCTYLIGPIALIIITRIVLAMGLYREVNGIYQIVLFIWR